MVICEFKNSDMLTKWWKLTDTHFQDKNNCYIYRYVSNYIQSKLNPSVNQIFIPKQYTIKPQECYEPIYKYWSCTMG